MPGLKTIAAEVYKLINLKGEISFHLISYLEDDTTNDTEITEMEYHRIKNEQGIKEIEPIQDTQK